MKPASLPFGRTSTIPLLMGVLNVTPDSFSDGGQFMDAHRASFHARRMMDEGADIIDIGGESTRPNATPLSPHDELQRVIPVIEAIREEAQKRQVLLSIDTRNAATMRAAMAAGAIIINDVSALTHDTQSISVVAETGAHVVLMHMQGTPQTMQDNPQYKNVVVDVTRYLESRIHACVAAGISKEKIIADVGIGFGKTPQHNVALIKNTYAFHILGVPLLVGTSRKSFISAVAGECAAEQRLGGSIASALHAARQGAQILRIHDVAATRQALLIDRELSPVA